MTGDEGSRIAARVRFTARIDTLRALPCPALPPCQRSMSEDSSAKEAAVTCSTCQARCCRLEVLLITDTGVPEQFIAFDRWGGMTMARLDDGWCAALDRSTMLCTIYDRRPWICREFEMGGHACLVERG